MPENIVHDSIPAFVKTLANKGVRLWERDGNLHYRSAAGALTGAELATLRNSKDRIIRLLREAKSIEESAIEPTSGTLSGLVPLSFSQMAHWRMYGLDAHPSICLVCCTLRVSGNLDLAILRESIEALIRRHDALRTRIVLLNAEPMQRVLPTAELELKLHDLSTLTSEVQAVESARLISSYQLEPTVVVDSALFKVRILRINDLLHALILSMEHIIADGFSMEVLLRELFFTYSCLSAGQPAALPPVLIQFPAYSQWQHDRHAAWSERHGQYWNEIIHACDRLAFPSDTSRDSEVNGDWGLVTFKIDVPLKARMRDWCKAHATTTVMYALAIYVVLVLRWCRTRETVILCENDGRGDPATRNTIGYFASPLYLRLHASQEDRFTDVLQLTMSEYSNALTHADHSYFESVAARPGFTRNTCFNWLPQSSSFFASPASNSEAEISVQRLPFEHQVVPGFHKDVEPTLGVTELERHAIGWIQFPTKWFHRTSMERFARSYVRMIEQSLDRPNICVHEFICEQDTRGP